MVPTIARHILYRKPLAQMEMVIRSPSFSALHQCTVRTVVLVWVPSLRTALKSWVPSKARPARRISSMSRCWG